MEYWKCGLANTVCLCVTWTWTQSGADLWRSVAARLTAVLRSWSVKRYTCHYPRGTCRTGTSPAKGIRKLSYVLHIHVAPCHTDSCKGRWGGPSRRDWTVHTGTVECRRDSVRSAEVPRRRPAGSLPARCRGPGGWAVASCRSRCRDRGTGCAGCRRKCVVVERTDSTRSRTPSTATAPLAPLWPLADAHAHVYAWWVLSGYCQALKCQLTTLQSVVR